MEVSIGSWHAHWLINPKYDAVEVMVGRLKTRMRQAVDRGPIWTSGYDARYCFDDDSKDGRRAYIRRHRGWRQLHYAMAAPWPNGEARSICHGKAMA